MYADAVLRDYSRDRAGNNIDEMSSLLLSRRQLIGARQTFVSDEMFARQTICLPLSLSLSISHRSLRVCSAHQT